jgi:hypothetical protein
LRVFIQSVDVIESFPVNCPKRPLKERVLIQQRVIWNLTPPRGDTR